MLSEIVCVGRSGGQGKSQYCLFQDENDKVQRFHGHVSGFSMVDHINRYPLDNRLENLRNTTHTENNKNKTNTNQTSLMTGVTFSPKDEAWRGRIKVDGKEEGKQFSIKLYGYEEAKQMAMAWRQEMAEQTGNFVNKTDEQDANKHPDFARLKSEYETIMTENAIGFKWKD